MAHEPPPGSAGHGSTVAGSAGGLGAGSGSGWAAAWSGASLRGGSHGVVMHTTVAGGSVGAGSVGSAPPEPPPELVGVSPPEPVGVVVGSGGNTWVAVWVETGMVDHEPAGP